MTKNNVIKLHGESSNRKTRLYQDPVAAQLFTDMLEAYKTNRLAVKNNTPKTVENDLRLVTQLAQHSGKYPWEWRIEDWDHWNSALYFERGISRATQRKNQGSIKNFVKYISSREVFRREVREKFDSDIDQFIDDEEILHHLFDREQKEPRLAFTPELADQFFEALKDKIKQQSTSKSRTLLNLQRDLALFYLMKATGLRIGSILALNIDSFAPNPNIPEMGKFGMLTTIGKGSHGSGPKILSPPIDDIKVPALLEWYINDVRPYYLRTSNPDERALFLSERGKRLSYASCWHRLQQRLSDAGLSMLKLCNHSFRHGKASECGMTSGVETARRMLGHAYASTTQGYMSIPDEYCQNQIDKVIKNQLARVIEREQAASKPTQSKPSTEEENNE